MLVDQIIAVYFCLIAFYLNLSDLIFDLCLGIFTCVAAFTGSGVSAAAGVLSAGVTAVAGVIIAVLFFLIFLVLREFIELIFPAAGLGGLNRLDFFTVCQKTDGDLFRSDFVAVIVILPDFLALDRHSIRLYIVPGIRDIQIIGLGSIFILIFVVIRILFGYDEIVDIDLVFFLSLIIVIII